jgi:hypothetical protein
VHRAASVAYDDLLADGKTEEHILDFMAQNLHRMTGSADLFLRDMYDLPPGPQLKTLLKSPTYASPDLYARSVLVRLYLGPLGTHPLQHVDTLLARLIDELAIGKAAAGEGAGGVTGSHGVGPEALRESALAQYLWLKDKFREGEGLRQYGYLIRVHDDILS